VLIADARQLANYAGQTVRVSGHTAGQNFIIPDRVEVRQSGGNFQEVVFSKPHDTAQAAAEEK